jgi:hypothetical protein
MRISQGQKLSPECRSKLQRIGLLFNDLRARGRLAFH